MAKRWGKKWKQGQILFSGAPKSLWTVTVAVKLKDACSLEGKLWVLLDSVKKQSRHFVDKGPQSQSYGLFCSHVRM